VLQAALNPSGREVQRFGRTFRVGDKVMQIINDYDKDVFNGDIGRIVGIDEEDQEVSVRFDERSVTYDFGELDELVLAYASTVHKAQGSEYPCVVLPVHTQHYMLLYRDLLYTAITRARKLLVMVGTKRAVATATHRVGSRTRVTTLQERLRDEGEHVGYPASGVAPTPAPSVIGFDRNR
jgi:exodeoxyribonuclease V alpha subunit